MTVASTLFAVVITGWIIRLLPMSRFSLWTGLLVAIAIVASLILVSFDGLTLVGYLQGGFGEFSAATCVAVGVMIFERVTGQVWINRKERVLFYRLVLGLGLCLYPMSLGLSYFDPYVLGYYPTLLSVGCMLIAGLAIWQDNRLLVVWLLAVALMYKLTLLESINLWDYMIDPWIFIYSFFVVLRRNDSSVD